MNSWIFGLGFLIEPATTVMQRMHGELLRQASRYELKISPPGAATLDNQTF
jgi:hypothetical protein